MNRYLLLILLCCWSHVIPFSLECDTGVAEPNHELSVMFSTLANADVALLKTYTTQDEQACIKDCCIEKYGSCTVASFKKNTTTNNCQLFNCRPVMKCKFVSSNTTDSFSFSSTTSLEHLVPSSAHSSSNHNQSSNITTIKAKVQNSSQNEAEHAVTKEVVVTFSEEETDLKNDNTTIKPRKGVDDLYSPQNDTKSGIKPRKGVTLDGISPYENSKSKVKPRKGVGPYESNTALPKSATHTSSHHNVSSAESYNADDVVSALQKVFEDDVKEKSDIKTTTPVIEVTSTFNINKSSFVAVHPSTSTPFVSSFQPLTLQSSFSTSYVLPTSTGTPSLQTFSSAQSTRTFTTVSPSTNSSSILEHSKILFHDTVEVRFDVKKVIDDKEVESDRKYKSSMHLVLSLVFGLLVLFAVIGVIVKRIYDNWMRRHYRRMDFLIDGMYNGYG